MIPFPWVEGKSQRTIRQESRADGWGGLHLLRWGKSTRVDGIPGKAALCHPWRLCLVVQCCAGFQGRFYNLCNPSRDPKILFISPNLERFLYLLCLLILAQQTYRAHSFLAIVMRTYRVPDIVLVARSFAESKTEKIPAIMDLIFYSRRKINKQQINDYICTVSNKWYE